MWQLTGSHAQRLAPREARFLRARAGTLWVALESAPGTPRAAAVDHILGPGERLLVQAGQTAVISRAGSRDAPAWFDWQPLPARRAAVSWRSAALQMLAQFGMSAAPAR
jgi:hypothetical protein